ncbi:Polyubiquitin-B isoform X3 [Oopsacas minuta]|uniref:Polyubiquitin-B isoform X3 n=1 Tax=Oopsacas minuta TaxID=111878 RepID=A0AAV7JAW6_9METZ|nr:Polyubiquitin-B isoform X3 [Oopsacas minuta]
MSTEVYDSLNIESLSDARLGECLKSYGYPSLGPITSSTRGVYMRKLLTLVGRSGSNNLNGPFTTPIPIANNHTKSPSTGRSRGKRVKSTTSSETSFGSPQNQQNGNEDPRTKISKIESPSSSRKIENSIPFPRSKSYSPRLGDHTSGSAPNSSPDLFFSGSLEGCQDENSLYNRSCGSSSSSSRSDQSLDSRMNRGTDISIPGYSMYVSSADQQRGLVRDLLYTLNNPKFVGSDVCFQTSHGDRLFASRAVLAARCPSMVPYLYSTEVAVPLKVMTLTGQMCVVWARPSDLIANVKYRIFFQQGIHMKAQRLVYDQKEMLDHMSLSSFGIYVASTIHLLISSDAAPTNDIPDVEQSLQTQEEAPVPAIPCLVSQSSLPLGMKSPLNSFKQEMIRDAMSSLRDSADGEKEESLPFHVEHVVYLPGVDHGCAQSFLRYLYSDTIDLNLSQVVQIATLAHTFSIHHLKNQSLEYLRQSINENHIIDILHEAERFGCEEITEICHQYAKKNNIQIEERMNHSMVTENLSRMHLTQ